MDKFSRPCPVYQFAIIGDSNVARWDLGPGCPNLGIGGNTSKMMAARFNPDTIAAKTGTVIIWATSNDAHVWAHYGVRYIREMALKARASGLRVILTTPLPVIDQTLIQSGHSQAETDDEISHTAAAVRSLGSTQGFPVADLHAAIFNKGSSLNKSLYIAERRKDGTINYEHLNAIGDIVIWKVIKPLISEISSAPFRPFPSVYAQHSMDAHDLSQGLRDQENR